jgi:methionyl-tRNA formyltransferase
MSGKKLRIVFMGTPDFAVESLRRLVEGGYQIVAVVTTPDKPAGRGQKMSESAVKVYAQSVGIPILQPLKLKDPDFVEELRSFNPDLQVVVAFRMLPEVVWDMPRLGTFNLHASLLPRYRGAAPLNWAIMNGDTESGVSTFKLQHEIDTGNIIFQERTPIGPDDTVADLHDRLMEIGSALVVKTVDALADGFVQFINQNELIATGQETCHAPKIFKETCKIDWSKTCNEIKNKVRGLSPYPAAWTELKHLETEELTTAKIFAVQLVEEESEAPIGTIRTDGKKFMHVRCADGWLQIDTLQLAGKKSLPVVQFLMGYSRIADFKAV